MAAHCPDNVATDYEQENIDTKNYEMEWNTALTSIYNMATRPQRTGTFRVASAVQ